MSQCGNIEFLSGGTINQSSIVSSTITNSDLTGGTISSAAIESLKSVDSNSAKVIAEALAGMDEASKKALAEALGFAPGVGQAPASTTEDSLPTEVLGDRDQLLGAPAEWVSIGGKNVPAY